MLVFKARPRKSPNLAEEITPSQRRIMRLLMDARDRVQDSIVLRDLEDRIEHRSADSTANYVTVDPWIDMQQSLADELYTEYVDAGRRAMVAKPVAKQSTTIDMAIMGYGYVPITGFDADRTQARDWADKEAAALVRDITDEQREVIREVIVRSTQGEYTVSQVARQVRGTIGLTSRQAQWVENFRQRQIDEAISRGVSSERAPSVVQDAVDKYHKRIHRYRSETIARTETIRASSEGRQAAWQQGLQDGFISPLAEKRWIVEFDGCSICMNNGIAGWIPINDTWSTGDPPAHPNCRCDVILRDDPTDDLTDMSDEELAAEIQSLIDAQPVTPATEQVPGIQDRADDDALPPWAEEAGLKDLLDRLPADRGDIGFRLETDDDLREIWEQQHNPNPRASVTQIREDAAKADKDAKKIPGYEKEITAAEAVKADILRQTGGRIPDVFDDTFGDLATDYLGADDKIRRAERNISDIRSRQQARDRLETALAEAEPKYEGWLTTQERKRVVDIDPVTGKPGEDLRRDLRTVQEIGKVISDETDRRLPASVRRKAIQDYTDDDVRLITETRETVLSELRPMDDGEDIFDFKSFTGTRSVTLDGARVTSATAETRDHMVRGLQAYPSSWIEATRETFPEIAVYSSGRGFNYGGGIIAVSGKGQRNLSTAVHEIGHTMENTVPGLKMLEYAYLYERANRGGKLSGLKPIPYLGGEKYLSASTFPEVYTARIGVSSADAVVQGMVINDRNLNFEVFTTGTQATFPRSTDDVKYMDDDGAFQTWTLGLLGSL